MTMARALGPARPWRTVVQPRAGLVAALLCALVLHGVVLVLPALLAALHGTHAVGQPWAHWDAVYYVRLATDGYAPYVHGSDHTGLAFLPLYPLLLALPIHLGLPPDAVAIGLSTVCALVAVVLLALLAVQEVGPQAGARAVVLFAVTPAAFFLAIGYSESLYLALSLGAFLLLRRRRWTAAAALCALAAVTRPTGVLLALPYLVEWLRLYGRSPRAGLQTLAPLGLVAVPLLGVAAYDASLGASPLALLQVEHTAWHQSYAWPWSTLWGQATALLTLGAAGSSLLPVGLLDLGAALLALPLLVLAARRLPLCYTVYALAICALALGVHSGTPFYGRDVMHPFVLPLGSAHRYLLMAFPLAIAAALTLQRGLFFATAVLLALMQLGLAVLFLLRFWAG